MPDNVGAGLAPARIQGDRKGRPYYNRAISIFPTISFINSISGQEKRSSNRAFISSARLADMVRST